MNVRIWNENLFAYIELDHATGDARKEFEALHNPPLVLIT